MFTWFPVHIRLM